MDWEDSAPADDDEAVAEAPEDPNAGKRFWFEHATGAGKTVAAVGFVEASRTGGILILTHRRNLVDQFHGELRDRGYGKRIAPALLGHEDTPNGPVTVETYQWFVRNAGNVSDAYSIVICDEAHTALGEKTSAAIRAWTGPVFVGMTATGALIARHVTDLFPTQTSRFDLAQAARRGVISPLRCVRIPPGPGVRTIAKVPLRRGEVDTEFDQEMLAELLDQLPFNLAVADLYKTRFNGVPGVVYSAGVRHAYNVAQAFRDVGMKAQAVSGETPKRELAQILARYERGDIDVLVNAQLLAEGWNSPRATVCMHLAPTASKRIYQQRVGRVTRRHQGKEAGIVVDFVHPATKHDDPVVSLHSLLDRDVYRGGAIVVGPVRRGRGRRLRVERRVLPVTGGREPPDRGLRARAVADRRRAPRLRRAGPVGGAGRCAGRADGLAAGARDAALRPGRRAQAHVPDHRRRSQQEPALRLRALQEIASGRDAEAFDRALDFVESWPRDDKREGVKVVLQALAEKKIGRRDQANNWIWRCANMTREVHEEYAVQRWPETKRLLGLLVNSSGGAHARNARRLVHAARQQDRRLSAALLAAAIPHTAEAGEVINGARTRMSRKPAALARELLRNFPKGRGKAKRRAPPQGRGRGRRAGGRDGRGRDGGRDRCRDRGGRGRRRRDAVEPRRSRRRVADADPEASRRDAQAARRRPAAEAASRAARRSAGRGRASAAPRGRGRRKPAPKRTPRARKPPAAVEVVEVVEVGRGRGARAEAARRPRSRSAARQDAARRRRSSRSRAADADAASRARAASPPRRRRRRAPPEAPPRPPSRRPKRPRRSRAPTRKRRGRRHRRRSRAPAASRAAAPTAEARVEAARRARAGGRAAEAPRRSRGGASRGQAGRSAAQAAPPSASRAPRKPTAPSRRPPRPSRPRSPPRRSASRARRRSPSRPTATRWTPRPSASARPSRTPPPDDGTAPTRSRS